MIILIIGGVIVLAAIIVGIIFVVGLCKQAWFFGGKAGEAVMNVADQKKQMEEITKELKKISKETKTEETKKEIKKDEKVN